MLEFPAPSREVISQKTGAELGRTQRLCLALNDRPQNRCKIRRFHDRSAWDFGSFVLHKTETFERNWTPRSLTQLSLSSDGFILEIFESVHLYYTKKYAEAIERAVLRNVHTFKFWFSAEILDLAHLHFKEVNCLVLFKIFDKYLHFHATFHWFEL